MKELTLGAIIATAITVMYTIIVTIGIHHHPGNLRKTTK